MKNRLLIILSLLLMLTLEGLVLAEKTKSSSAAFNTDGAGVAQRRVRRKRRRRYRAQRPTSYPVIMTPGEAGAATPESPPPPPPPAPAQEMPNTSAPAPPEADPMDAPGQGRPAKKAGPRIKPPTVNIKPPTR